MNSDAQTVLVVDDDRMNILVLKGVLGRLGFEVLGAASGYEARKVASREQPDLILLDVMMPGESGFETCAQLKQDPSTSDIPVIFITCLSDEPSKMNGLDAGAVDYISKPFNIREVEAKVRNQLRSRLAQTSRIREQAGRLDQVKTAQRSLLVAPEDLPRARFAVSFVPVLEAGGDFYDVFEMPGGRVGYFVADVSGHDLGASLMTSSLKALLHRELPRDQSPLAILEDINAVVRSITQSRQYLTAVLAVLDREAMTLTSYCAGHPAPVYAPAEGQARILDSAGDILGFFPQVRIGETRVLVRPGDRLYLYTDGLVERLHEGRRTRGPAMDSLRDLCGLARSRPLDQAVAGVLEGLTRDAPPPEDDVILLGFEV